MSRTWRSEESVRQETVDRICCLCQDGLMLCAAIDIGSNTTRVLVAEPGNGQLRRVMEQRAYTRLGKASGRDGAIGPEKVAEVAEAVATQVRLAEEVNAE